MSNFLKQIQQHLSQNELMSSESESLVPRKQDGNIAQKKQEKGKTSKKISEEAAVAPSGPQKKQQIEETSERTSAQINIKQTEKAVFGKGDGQTEQETQGKTHQACSKEAITEDHTSNYTKQMEKSQQKSKHIEEIPKNSAEFHVNVDFNTASSKKEVKKFKKRKRSKRKPKSRRRTEDFESETGDGAVITPNIRLSNPFEILTEGYASAQKKSKQEKQVRTDVELTAKSSTKPITNENDFSKITVDAESIESMEYTKSNCKNLQNVLPLEAAQVSEYVDVASPLTFLDLVQRFSLELGCALCTVPLEPLPPPLGPGLLQHSPHAEGNSCLKNLVLSRKPPIWTQFGLVDWFVLAIRPPAAKLLPVGVAYKFCEAGPVECTYREMCHFAHNSEEMNIWNNLKEANQEFDSLIGYMQCDDVRKGSLLREHGACDASVNDSAVLQSPIQELIEKTAQLSTRGGARREAHSADGKKSFVVTSAVSVDLPCHGQMVKHVVHLGCNTCCNKVETSHYTLFTFPHSCSKIKVFVKNDKTLDGVWLKIRPRPNCKPARGYQMCHYLDRTCRLDDECQFAHSELEKSLWTADAKGEINLSSIWSKVRQRLASVTFPFADLDQADEEREASVEVESSSTDTSDQKLKREPSREAVPIAAKDYSLDNETSDQDSDQNIGEGIDDENACSGEKGSGVNCPFTVCYICGLCLKEFSGMVSFKSGSSCSNRKDTHNWALHKAPAVLDEFGKARLVRDVPQQLIGQVKRNNGKYNVQMCHHASQPASKFSKLQLESHERYYSCRFAHSDVEKKLWTWMLVNGKNVSDIVIEADFSCDPTCTRDSLSKSSDAVATDITCQPESFWKSAEAGPQTGTISHLTIESLERASYYCFLCNKTPRNRNQYIEHLGTAEHKKRDLLDKQEIWKFKQPPSSGPYDQVCNRHDSENSSCAKAHSISELNEWNQRIISLNNRLRIRIDKEHETLMEKYAQKQKTGRKNTNMLGVSVALQSEDRLYVPLKGTTSFTFEVDSEMTLLNVAIINRESMSYFRFLSPDAGEKIEKGNGDGIYMLNGETFQDSTLQQCYEVKVEFTGSLSAKSYETEILFDFGKDIMLSEKLYVSCGLENEEIEYMTKVIQNLHFELTKQTYCPLMQQWLAAEEQARQKILSSFHLITDKAMVTQNLLLENRRTLVAPFGSQLAILPVDSPLSEDVDITSLLLSDCESAFVSLRPYIKGQSGKIKVFEVDLLNRMNCSFDIKATQNKIFLCLSRNLTSFLDRKDGSLLCLEVQFNISGVQFEQWRRAVQLLSETEASMDLIFPDMYGLYKGWFYGSQDWWILPKKRASAFIACGIQLNIEQRKLVQHAVRPKSAKNEGVPPLVVFGPFGTGKTKAMACAVASMLIGDGNWGFDDGLILICTHSHTTADLYLKLIEELCSGKLSRDDLKKVVIRLFPKIRGTVASLPVDVQQYVPTHPDGTPVFLAAADIQRARVVVCTLFGANRLVQLSKEGHRFKVSHIFIDEAAQSLEAETLMPLCLTSSETRVIVAGDHNQIRPKVYLDKQFAEQLNMSYLERLYYHYENFMSKLDSTARQIYIAPNLLFNKNYRCHKGILEFVSAEFYGSETSLEACGESPETDISPLSFVCVDGGIETQSRESTSWCNWTEAECVADTVEHLCLNWPPEWGSIDIGVLVAYHDQIAIVRKCLFKRCENVQKDIIELISGNVGKVVTMQGKEFKALVISVVLTRNLQNTDISHRNLGFLDDARLINTAITRARYCATVVGDPVGLCSIGKCKNMWRRYLEKCALKNSIFPNGRTLSTIYDDLRHINQKSSDLMSVNLSQNDMFRSLDPDRLVAQLMVKTEMERIDIDYVSNDNDEENQAITDKVTEEEGAVLHIQSAYSIIATPFDDRTKPVIHIRSRKYCKTAFSGDVVLVEITDRTGGKVFGKVKEILQRLMHPEQKNYVCFADPYRPGQMVPIDPRIPKIFTKTKKFKNAVNLIEHRLVQNSTQFELEEGELIEINRANCFDNLYVVMYLRWDEQKWCPLGMIVERIKLERVEENRNGALLEQGLKIIDINYHVDDYVWSLDCYRQIESSSITKRGRNHEDFTHLICFTIDPPGSRDLDDALSVEKIKDEKDVYEVGIHIADVSVWIEKGTALDNEAKLRGLTLYRSDLGKPKHMLPDALSTDKFSLLQKRKRLCVSVFVQIRLSDAKIIAQRYTRSKVCSSYGFTYADVEEKLSNVNITTSDFSEVDRSLVILYTLASKLRMLRLGTTRAISQDVKYLNIPRSELLVSEWMILANHLVAKKIYDNFGDLAVVRKQLSPAEHLLNEWKQKHGDVLPFSLKYSNYADCGFTMDQSPAYFTVPKFHWDKIVQSKSARDLKILMGFEEVNPLLVPVDSQMRSIQERSIYTPVGEALTVWSHHQLNLSIYTHFTSPIRRYIDIVVHRMLTAGIERKTCPYSLEELKEICDHCTETTRNANHYEAECFKLKQAATVQLIPQTVYPVICSINEIDVRMEIPTFEKSVDSLMTLKYAHLYLKKNPELIQSNQRNRVLLSWQRELYSLEKQKASTYKTGQRIVELPSEQHVMKVPATLWWNLQQAIKQDLELTENNTGNVVSALDQAFVAALKEKSVCPEPTSELGVSEEKKEIVKKREVTFCTTWEESTMLKIQVDSQLRRGLFQPAVQLLYLSPKITLCIEHIRNASGCFANKPSRIIQKCYKSVVEYQKAWLPILSMESAHAMVSSRESVVISDVKVRFWQENDTVKASFSLPVDFCLKRGIQLSKSGDDDPKIARQLQKLARLDCFCIKTPIMNGNEEAFIWVGHFISVQVDKQMEKHKEIEQVLCNLINNCGSAFPHDFLADKGDFPSTVEIFISPMQFKKMQNTLFGLQDASFFVRRIALGKCPVSSSLSIGTKERKEFEQLIKEIKCDLPAPNKYQKQAIMVALSQPFALIWGPPGLFVNKILTKDKTIRVIRVYARDLEKMEFPLPFDRVSKIRHTFDASTGIDRNLKDISLHHLIRQSKNRFSREILELDAEFENIAAGRRTELNAVDIFRKIRLYQDKIIAAEKAELSNCDIILCTATTANRSRLHFLQPDKDDKVNFSVHQVILDEASMSPEPESLIPLMTTKCRNFVLVGDHKQLSPVILCKEAKDFGMDSTLFSKYVNNDFMLQAQYRMHEKIAEFPSVKFYEGKLKVALPIEQKTPGNTVWPSWNEPIVFCHCEGEEVMRVVTTSDAAEMSASNLLQVSHVLRIVNGLVTKHNVKVENIAVLTQYRAQVELIKGSLTAQNQDYFNNLKRNVLTVVNAQGGEWDYVIFTTVRSLPFPEIDPIPSISWVQRHIGSVADDHQICVALTRAKKGMLIIGNSNLLKVNETWKELITDYKNKHCFVENVADFMTGC